ncbi:MAG: L,D-transpeptidase family protein [Rhodocyclaceae bacterium]
MLPGRGLRRVVAVVVFSATAFPATAAPTGLPSVSHAYSGIAFVYQTQPRDSIASLSSRVGQAATDLVRANGLSGSAPLQPGTRLRMDSRHIVPRWMERGILINIPQRMLFLFENNQLIAAYPVGPGKKDWQTPTGRYAVTSLQENKTWFVPESIQAEMRQKGLDVKTSVPAGPGNPLGRYWIGTSATGIGIHATVAPRSVYGFHSHGCIRMNADDAQRLYAKTTKGMPVEIIYQPLMLARFADGSVFLEVHRDIYRRGADLMGTARDMALVEGIEDAIDWKKVATAAQEQAGAMRDISLRPPSLRPSPSADGRL